MPASQTRPQSKPRATPSQKKPCTTCPSSATTSQSRSYKQTPCSTCPPPPNYQQQPQTQQQQYQQYQQYQQQQYQQQPQQQYQPPYQQPPYQQQQQQPQQQPPFQQPPYPPQYQQQPQLGQQYPPQMQPQQPYGLNPSQQTPPISQPQPQFNPQYQQTASEASYVAGTEAYLSFENGPDHEYSPEYFAARRERAYYVRMEAAKLSHQRLHTTQVANQDEQRYLRPKTRKYPEGGMPSFITSFTKGLPHDAKTGLLLSSAHYELFKTACRTGKFADIRAIPLGPQRNGRLDTSLFTSGISKMFGGTTVRGWESMAAGLAFDLEGPDSHSVSMPPAPQLVSTELASEITELYWMALTRDIPFSAFGNSRTVAAAVDSINATEWIKNCKCKKCAEKFKESGEMDPVSVARARGPFTAATVFRGVLPGDLIGPYISQFLVRGAGGIGAGTALTTDAMVQYGANLIDLRVRVATPKRDYLVTWASWLDAQNGADLRGRDTYVDAEGTSGSPGYRYIATPRDLATYVHHDALYQAYLTATLAMLAEGIPLDPGLPFTGEDKVDKQQGFALFGGPHILTLVTEVATRALKAVRFQKFNIHRRGRPEAVCGMLEVIRRGGMTDHEKELMRGARELYKNIDDEIFKRVESHNKRQCELEDGGYRRKDDFSPVKGRRGTVLLPMAYAEGSPMHPTYGAGHATVAGACVTILKAFFDHTYVIKNAYEVNSDGTKLRRIADRGLGLTVEGELNKLCSNISIGRNWGGVHYYSDYIESIRLGERIALGILEEQKLTYGEDFKMTIPLFTGKTIQI